MTGKWLIPTLVYVVALGSLGVTSRLALRTYSWQQMLVWTTLVYLAVAIALMATGNARFTATSNFGWVILSAVIVVASLILLYTALGHGDAATVIPITAAYPAVTLILAAATLGERITAVRVLGVALVIVGVVVITRAQ